MYGSICSSLFCFCHSSGFGTLVSHIQGRITYYFRSLCHSSLSVIYKHQRASKVSIEGGQGRLCFSLPLGKRALSSELLF